MTAPRIITSEDEDVNQLAREQLSLPDGHPVGFEMLGRPPKVGELWANKNRELWLEDMAEPLDAEPVHPKCEAFRIVALGPDGKPCPRVHHSMPHCAVAKAFEIKTIGVGTRLTLPDANSGSGRVRVVQPAKQYARIEMDLKHGRFTLEFDEEGWDGPSEITIPKVELEDFPILAEAFRVAHHEWTKEES